MPERDLPPNKLPKLNMDKRRREMIQRFNRNRDNDVIPPPPPMPQGLVFVAAERNNFPVPLINPR
jgi:hypothetical protein